MSFFKASHEHYLCCVPYEIDPNVGVQSVQFSNVSKRTDRSKSSKKFSSLF